MSELERIIEAYKRRKGIDRISYSYFSPANLFMIQSRERKILEVIKRYVGEKLDEKKILDVGCGEGGELRNFLKYGAKPENLYGIDLLEDRIERARRINPNVNFTSGNAERLPYPECFFDLVTQFTVFTSIFDENMKRNIAREMLRVLKDDGIILWYDFIYNNPKNPDVKGIKKREITSLFPGCKFDFQKITLAPIITRAIAPYSWFACYLLEKIRIFNTHYLVVIRKNR